MTVEQQMILQMVQDGKISPDEAERLLAALRSSSHGAPDTGAAAGQRPDAGVRGGTHAAGGAAYSTSFGSGSASRSMFGPGSAFSKAFGAGGTFSSTFGPGGSFATTFGAGGNFASTFGPEEIITPSQSEDLEETFETTAPLPASGRIRLTDAHGGVNLEAGDVEEVQVRVLKRVRALDPDLGRQVLRDFQIHVAVEGDELVVRSSRPRPQDYSFQNAQERLRGMWAFYQLVVPRRAGAAVGFQHGKVRVAGLEGPVELVGAHGEWQAQDLAGPVRLKHEHGAVRLANLGAGLEVRKSHGPLEVARVEGDLALKAEHSQVRLEGVSGAAELAGGHGEWDVRDFAGPVRLKHEHGDMRLINLGAGLEAHKGHGVLVVDGVRGELRLQSSHGDRRLQNVDGPVEIRHGHGALELLGLGAGLQVEASHSPVHVEFADPLAGDVTMRLGHCRASLRLPATSSARLDLATSHGHIEAPGLPVVEKGRHSIRVQGSLGSGLHAVAVEGNHTSLEVSIAERPDEVGDPAASETTAGSS